MIKEPIFENKEQKKALHVEGFSIINEVLLNASYKPGPLFCV
jgi:hypothetical protein